MPGHLAHLATQHGVERKFDRNRLRRYEHHFDQLQKEPIRLLAIGASEARLCMWRDYFPNGIISGLGSSTDVRGIARIEDEVGRPNIAIVDGALPTAEVIATFWIFFPLVTPKGWYVLDGVPPPSGNQGSLTALEFLKRFVDGLGARGKDPDAPDIDGLYFHDRIVFVQKGPATEV